MKSALLIAGAILTLSMAGCAATQPQQAQSEQTQPTNTSSTTGTREVRNAAHEASATARDVRGTIYDLKSIFR